MAPAKLLNPSLLGSQGIHTLPAKSPAAAVLKWACWKASTNFEPSHPLGLPGLLKSIHSKWVSRWEAQIPTSSARLALWLTGAQVGARQLLHCLLQHLSVYTYSLVSRLHSNYTIKVRLLFIDQQGSTFARMGDILDDSDESRHLNEIYCTIDSTCKIALISIWLEDRIIYESIGLVQVLYGEHELASPNHKLTIIPVTY